MIVYDFYLQVCQDFCVLTVENKLVMGPSIILILCIDLPYTWFSMSVSRGFLWVAKKHPEKKLIFCIRKEDTFLNRLQFF